MAVFGRTVGSGSCLTAHPNGKQVLPVMTPKLSWRTDEAQRHARLHSQSSQTFALIKHFPADGVEAIALYSMKDKFCQELPPIPPLERGIPRGAEIISFDGGKVYVLGGYKGQSTMEDRGRHVYVLDLAGEMQWKRCASMRESRDKFGCGAIGGKIYAFGGLVGNKPVSSSEVYDPMEDAWSPIRSMISARHMHRVERIDGKLFVHGGRVDNPNLEDLERIMMEAHEGEDLDELEMSVLIVCEVELAKDRLNLQAYDPVRDQWTVEAEPESSSRKAIFMAQGKLHGMCSHSIYVHDFAIVWSCVTNPWVRLHRHSFPDLGARVSVFGPIEFPFAVQAVGDELLAIVCYSNTNGIRETSLVRCTGLGSETEEIVWHKVQAPLSFPVSWEIVRETRFFITPIRLSISTDRISPGYATF